MVSLFSYLVGDSLNLRTILYQRALYLSPRNNQRFIYRSPGDEMAGRCSSLLRWEISRQQNQIPGEV